MPGTSHIQPRLSRLLVGNETPAELRFVACTGEEAKARYGDIPWLGDELVVVGDEREVWAGPAAFILCLWALEDWREWSYRISGTAFAPLAERFFLMVSAKRKNLAAFLGHSCDDGTCRIVDAS